MESEHSIQNRIRLSLSERGFFTERINVGSGFLVNKSLMAKIKARCRDLKKELDGVQYFSTGAQPGRSDLSAIKDGRIYFIEVKKPGGHIRPEQIKFLDNMRKRYGCRGGIAYSVEDALKIVEGDTNV